MSFGFFFEIKTDRLVCIFKYFLYLYIQFIEDAAQRTNFRKDFYFIP
ncbi:hypothetical protein FLAPXU55_04800 [Flavobacterium panici]|uniref:Uncharacterized protein n=1 Tax=Flavobacterium panici TaxID=2654843 RepID=A0A9N8J9F9_9FLAO|nr:hypothetical protein FLAPXU55_04800 [Flavobacterium panici]